MFGLGAFLAGFGGVMGGSDFRVYPRFGFRTPFIGLCGGHCRRQRQSSGVGGGKHIGGIGGQLRQGPDPVNSPTFTLFAPMALVVALKPRALWKRSKNMKDLLNSQTKISV